MSDTRKELAKQALPYVEAVIIDLENEVDYEMDYTEAQKAVQSQLAEAREFAALLRSIADVKDQTDVEAGP